MSISEETKFPCHVGITDLKSKQECNKWTLLITKLYKFIIVNNKKKSGDKSPRIKKLFIGQMKKSTCLFKVTMSFNGGVSVKILIDWKVVQMKLFFPIMIWLISMLDSEIVMETLMVFIKIGDSYTQVSQLKFKELM